MKIKDQLLPEKLRLKLNKVLKLNIPKYAIFKRTHAGYRQLSSGAWKWYCWYPESPYDIGSPYSVGEILKAKRISIFKSRLGGGIEIEIDS